MRVAIIGSRSVQLESLHELLVLLPLGTHEIISGGAEGADQIAEQIAHELSLPITVFRPDYAHYQRRAPLLRNDAIVRYADYVIALWDGKSRGTAHVIERCIQEYTPVRVFLCRDGKLTPTLFGKDRLL